MKYNLNDLHWQQFELLSFNILQRLVAYGIQFIEGGSDKGRDIIYEGKSHVFQPFWDAKWIFQIKPTIIFFHCGRDIGHLVFFKIERTIQKDFFISMRRVIQCQIAFWFRLLIFLTSRKTD